MELSVMELSKLSNIGVSFCQFGAIATTGVEMLPSLGHHNWRHLEA